MRVVSFTSDLGSSSSVTIPQKEDPRLEKLVKRIELGRPLGIHRLYEDEFLLCYDGRFFLGHLRAKRSDVVYRIRAVCR